jgi:hypothetical protein
MEQQQPRSSSPYQFTSAQVLARFALRIVLLTVFASFGVHGFAIAFSALASLAALFCAMMAAIRQEPILGPALTHWDEAAAYVVIGWCLRTASAVS